MRFGITVALALALGFVAACTPRMALDSAPAFERPLLSQALAAAPASTPTAFPTPTPGPTPASAAADFGTVEIPNAAVEYYPVSGATAAEIRVDLDRKRPDGHAGMRYDSVTRWEINWTWPGYGSPTCDLGLAVVHYQITVVFPRWTPPAGASPDLMGRWLAFTRSLAAHEAGHAAIVVNRFPLVLAAIHRAPCETAEAAAQRAVGEIRQAQNEYDAQTQHGASQGARFP